MGAGPRSLITGAGPYRARVTPPVPVERSFRLWIAAVVVNLLGSVVSLVTTPPVSAISSIVGLVVGLLFLVAVVFLALRLRQGDSWARLTLAVLGGLSAVITVLGLLAGAGLGVGFSALSAVVGFVQAALIVAAILFSFQAPANAYFD
jgi:hypothetical protein